MGDTPDRHQGFVPDRRRVIDFERLLQACSGTQHVRRRL
jgi:hypothetical protein